MKGRKATKDLTDAELLLLGLVAEMPRHGYDLEREIERRGMREWTQIGFSSVYFVLGKLEKAGLIRAKQPTGTKARKTLTLTSVGRRVLVAQASAALRTFRPTYSSLLLGMIHWPALEREEALDALSVRHEQVEAELARLAEVQVERQPLPDYVEALFEWRFMIPAPEWATAERFADDVAQTEEKQGKAPRNIRLDRYHEGESVQIMHVGHHEEGIPTVTRLHCEVLPARKLVPNGPHHEIYLTDPNRVAPEKRKTVFRQPVRGV